MNDRLRWIARQGRDFGLAFASTHSIHLLLVIWLYRLSPEPPISTQDAVFFSIGMLWMYLLAVLSIQHLAQLLGPSLWRKLRLVGMEYIMLAFQSDFLLNSLITTLSTHWATCRSRFSAWQARHCASSAGHERRDEIHFTESSYMGVCGNKSLLFVSKSSTQVEQSKSSTSVEQSKSSILAGL